MDEDEDENENDYENENENENENKNKNENGNDKEDDHLQGPAVILRLHGGELKGLQDAEVLLDGGVVLLIQPLLQLLSRLQFLLLLVFCSTLILLSASAHPPRAEPPQPPCPEQTMVEAGAIRVVLPRKRIIWVLKKTSQILHFWLYLKNLKKYIRPIMVGQDFFGWLRFPFA